MPDRPITVGEIQAHARTLSAMAAALVTGLASGKYDRQVAFTENMLTELGLVFPPAAMAEKALEIFLLLNKMTAPRAPLVLAGDGISWVPDSNSRYDPKTGKFL
jgi:hypothetical protein